MKHTTTSLVFGERRRVPANVGRLNFLRPNLFKLKLSLSLAGGIKRFIPAFSVLLILLLQNLSVTSQTAGNHCKLNCRDTVFCFGVPDSAVHPPVPTFSGADPNGGAYPCSFDSMWNNAPLV